jgi:hypothetical protein
MMIAVTMNAAISESARSGAFDRGFAVASAGIMTLCRRPQFADEPANISGLHWIRRDSDFFDAVACGAFEGAKFESRRSRRDVRQHHANLALRAAKALDCEQGDGG